MIGTGAIVGLPPIAEATMTNMDRWITFIPKEVIA